jgi:hypothetical protein
MSKMPIDREEQQRDIFRRFGIPRLNAIEPTKPITKDDKPEKADKKKEKKP